MVFVAKIFQGIEIPSDKFSLIFGVNIKGCPKAVAQVIFNASVDQGFYFFVDQIQVPIEYAASGLQ